MSQLRFRQDVQIGDPIEIFGIVTAPTDEYAEFMRDAVSRTGAKLDEVRYDNALEVLRLPELYAPVDMQHNAGTLALEGATLVGSGLRGVVGRTTRKVNAMQTAAVVGTEWSYTQNQETPRNVLVSDGQGYWITCSRGAPISGAVLEPYATYIRFAFELDTTELDRWLRISWEWGKVPYLQRGTCDETTPTTIYWDRIGDIPMADGGHSQLGVFANLRFSIMRANGRYVFRASPSNAVSETALVIPDRGFDILDGYVVTGMNLNADFSLFPMTFPAQVTDEVIGTFTSAVIPKVWGTGTSATAEVTKSINNYSNYVQALIVTEAENPTLTNWTSQYKIQFDGYDTTDPENPVQHHLDGTFTPYIRWVRVKYPSTGIEPVIPPTSWESLPDQEGFTLQQQFDPMALTVHRAGSVTCRNMEGQYSNAYGMRAVKIIAGVEYRNGENEAWTELWSDLRFVGWLGMDTDTTYTQWTASLMDRIDYELNVPLGMNIQVDDTCIYHTAKMLFEKAQIHQSWLKPVMPNAPADAWTCDGYTCRGTEGHLRIGAGTSMSPLYQFNEEMTIWQCLQVLAQDFGMAVGFDEAGYAVFYPWSIWTARDDWDDLVPQPPIFSLVPTFDGTTPNLNEMVGNLVKHTSLGGVRNSITLRSMDPISGSPIIGHVIDRPSIGFDDEAGTVNRVPNFMGRARHWVRQDAKFSIQEFADEAAARLLAIYKEPVIDYRPLEVLPQPFDVLDYIGIVANRTLSADDKFYVGGINESQDALSRTYRMFLTPIRVPDSRLS